MPALSILSFNGPTGAVTVEDAASSNIKNAYILGAPYVRALYAVNLDASFGFGNVTRYNLPRGKRGTIVHAQANLTASPGITPNIVASDALILPAPSIGINLHQHASHSTLGSAEGLPILQITPGCNLPLDLRLSAGVDALSCVAVSFYDDSQLAIGGQFTKNMSALDADYPVPLYNLSVNFLIRWDEAS